MRHHPQDIQDISAAKHHLTYIIHILYCAIYSILQSTVFHLKYVYPTQSSTHETSFNTVVKCDIIPYVGYEWELPTLLAS